MAVYPAQRSVLVIEPIGLTIEDIECLKMEKNSLEYFVSVNDNPPRPPFRGPPVYQAKIYEDTWDNYDFSEIEEGAVTSDPKGVFRVVSENSGTVKFLYFNLLKNTAWAAEEFGVSNYSVLKYIDKGLINGIRSANGKYGLVIPDKKFYDFLSQKQTRVNMAKVSSSQNSQFGNKVHKKILTVIKSGVFGGFGQPITVEDVLPHMPGESRSKINSALATLLKHGDLVRVHILDSTGNPTSSFAPGKYRINIVPAAQTVAPVSIPVPVPPSIPEPVEYPLYLSRAYRGVGKKSNGRVALEKFLNENMVDEHILFTSKQLKKASENLTARDIVDTMKVVKRLNKHVKFISNGVWEYRNRKDIPWYTGEQRVAIVLLWQSPKTTPETPEPENAPEVEVAKKEPSTIGDIVKDLRGAGFSEKSLVEIMKTVVAEKIKNS